MDRMTPGEFRSNGFLQELNRLFLNPLGLAQVIEVDRMGNEVFGDIVDISGSREEELKFDSFDISHFENAKAVKERFLSRINQRKEIVGSVIQRIIDVDDEYTIEDKNYGIGWYTSGDTDVLPEDVPLCSCGERNKYLTRKYDNLIKLLNADQSIGLKFKLTDAEQSRELQEVLFGFNIGWAFVEKTQILRNLEAPYLIVDNGLIHVISTENDFNVTSQSGYDLPK